MEYRQSNDIFFPVGIATRYAWNIAPIDGTDIICSTITIGREFSFPIEINLSVLPQRTQNNTQSTIDCLNFTDSNRRFSSSILKLFIEDRRATYAELVNNNKHIFELVVGDMVMTRTAIQSDVSTNRVGKLIYQVRGPFRIIKCTSRGSYLVRKLYKTDSPELKFMAIDLYSLSPSLKLCEPINSSAIRYMNQLYSPTVNPLSKPLNIEIYNETWFNKPPQTSQPMFNYNYPTLAFPEPQLTPFTSLSDLHAETNTIPLSS